jgi:hypothetical protein
MDTKTHGDIDAEVDPKFQCLKSITYVSLAKLQPSLSYEPHEHQDHEEIYYIINGSGHIKIGDEIAKFRDGGFGLACALLLLCRKQMDLSSLLL